MSNKLEQVQGLFKQLWNQVERLLKDEPVERALSMGNIFNHIWDVIDMKYPMAYLHDIFAEENNTLFAILSQEGKLYRAEITVMGNEVGLGKWVEVVQEFRPITERTRTQIIRQADGRARWFSISATSVLNRVGEIDSQQLFDSFIAHANETKEYPYRTFYHKGEAFRTGQADFLARDGNCYITSGLYDDSEIARAEQAAIEAEPDFWGESIGYLPTSQPELLDVSGVTIPVYRTGIHKEISTLPEREAANLFTVIRQEVNRMMTANEQAAFLKLFGGDEEKMQAWLEENVDATNRAIETGGLITRSQEQPEDEVQESPAVEIDEALLVEIVNRATGGEVFTKLQAQQQEIAEAIQEINQAAETLAGQLATLQKDVTERLAKLERGKVQERQEWAADLPAKANVTRVGLKPRFAPEQPEDDKPETSTDKANATLAKLPAYN